MGFYDIIIIFKEENFLDIKNNISVIKKLIIYNNGLLIKIENLGLIKFSYIIKGSTRGWYFCFNVKINIDILNKINYYLKFNKIILRFLIIKFLKRNYIINYFINKKLKLKLRRKIKKKKIIINNERFKKKR